MRYSRWQIFPDDQNVAFEVHVRHAGGGGSAASRSSSGFLALTKSFSTHRIGSRASSSGKENPLSPRKSTKAVTISSASTTVEKSDRSNSKDDDMSRAKSTASNPATGVTMASPLSGGGAGVGLLSTQRWLLFNMPECTLSMHKSNTPKKAVWTASLSDITLDTADDFDLSVSFTIGADEKRKLGEMEMEVLLNTEEEFWKFLATLRQALILSPIIESALHPSANGVTQPGHLDHNDGSAANAHVAFALPSGSSSSSGVPEGLPSAKSSHNNSVAQGGNAASDFTDESYSESLSSFFSIKPTKVKTEDKDKHPPSAFGHRKSARTSTQGTPLSMALGNTQAVATAPINLAVLTGLQVPRLTVDRFYHVGDEVGQGTFGKVYRGYDYLVRKDVAIKRMLLVPGEEGYLQQEVEILRFVPSHENILVPFDVFEDEEGNFDVIMDYMPDGDLFDIIDNGNRLSEAKAASIMKPLISAVMHLHHARIVHRDIKLDNVLVRYTDAERTWPPSIRLGDFSFAVFLERDQKFVIENSFVGTMLYLAPESICKKEYGYAVDVWACGVIFFMLLSGKFPFWGDGDTEYLKAVVWQELEFPEHDWGHLSDQVKDLLRKMLAKEPDQRIELQNIVNHPWFQNFSSLHHTPPRSPNPSKLLHKMASPNITRVRSMSPPTTAEKKSIAADLANFSLSGSAAKKEKEKEKATGPKASRSKNVFRMRKSFERFVATQFSGKE